MKNFSRKGAKYLLLIRCSLRLIARAGSTESHSTRVRATMSPEAKALVEDAIGVVCTQAKLDPKSSVAIDEMQARPSLPIHSPEARSAPSAHSVCCRSPRRW